MSGKADEILQRRISQLIKESGAEIERIGPKILRGAIEDLYKTSFGLVGRKLTQLKRKLKTKAVKYRSKIEKAKRK